MKKYFNNKYFLASILFVLSLLTVSNLFHSGYPLTHDGDVHLLRLTNFYQSMHEGNLVPRWAANVNFGFGQPVFEFFYPLPYYIASFFHLIGISFSDSLKIILISGMLFSGLAMFLWLSEVFGISGGFAGGMLYLFAPYRFVDTYVRGDVGENLAFVFIPLILWCIFKIEKKPTFLWSILGGIFFALLILTHNVVSLMSIPFILFYGLFCFYYHNKRKLFGGYLFWMIFMGFALSAFFWLPGLIEGRYTLRDIVTKGEYIHRFVEVTSLFYGPWSYGGSGEFTVQLGIMQWIVLLGSLVTVPFVWKRNEKNTMLGVGAILYTLTGIFFMLPISGIIWSNILLLQNFQFPWRFLVITIIGSSILGAYLISFVPKKFTLPVLSAFVLLVLFLNRDYMHPRSFVNRPDSSFIGIQQSPADTGESSPVWTVRFMEKGFLHPLEVITGDAQIQIKKRTTTEHSYTVQVYKTTRFVENTLYFPGWNIQVNGLTVPIQFQDEQFRGLMTFYLNPGNYTIDVKFVDTKFRKVADILSLSTSIIVCTLTIYLLLKATIKKDPKKSLE